MKKLGLALAAVALPGVASAQAAKQCVTTAQLHSTALFAAPQLIRTIGNRCAAQLAANAYLRSSGASLAARYDQAATVAWPTVKTLANAVPDLRPLALLDAKAAQTLLGGIVDDQIGKRGLKTGDCSAISDVLAALDPLPPENMANLIVAFVKFGVADDRRKGKKADWLCPTA